MKGYGNDRAESSAKIRLVMAMFIFGTLGIYIRHIPLPSSVIAFLRGVIGTLFLVIFIKVKKIKIYYAEIKNNFLILCMSGMLIGVNWIFLFEAYHYTTVAVATLCYYLAPVFIMLASPFMLREKLTLRKVLCIVAALAGMIFVSGVLKKGGMENLQIKGILFGVGAAVIYAAVVIMNKYLKRISSYAMATVQLGTAALILFPYILATQNMANLVFSPTTVILLAVVGIINTGVSYSLYFSIFHDLNAQTIAIFSYIDPIVAILMSTIFLSEIPDVFTIIGAVLILGSTFVSEMG